MFSKDMKKEDGTLYFYKIAGIENKNKREGLTTYMGLSEVPFTLLGESFLALLIDQPVFTVVVVPSSYPSCCYANTQYQIYI